MENRWTRYRAAKLSEMGLSKWEIMALKYNKMTNPRVALFLKDIRAEVDKIRVERGLSSHSVAAEFRRDNWEWLVDMGEIEEYDPYIRMGYWD